MRPHVISVQCLIGSGLACIVLSLVKNMESIVILITLPYAAALLVSLYIGRRYPAVCSLSTCSLAVTVMISIGCPLAIASQGGHFQELGFVVGVGVFALALVVMPVLCVAASMLPKRNMDDRRGFPVSPVPRSQGEEKGA